MNVTTLVNADQSAEQKCIRGTVDGFPIFLRFVLDVLFCVACFVCCVAAQDSGIAGSVREGGARMRGCRGLGARQDTGRGVWRRLRVRALQTPLSAPVSQETTSDFKFPPHNAELISPPLTLPALCVSFATYELRPLDGLCFVPRCVRLYVFVQS